MCTSGWLMAAEFKQPAKFKRVVFILWAESNPPPTPPSQKKIKNKNPMMLKFGCLLEKPIEIKLDTAFYSAMPTS